MKFQITTSIAPGLKERPIELKTVGKNLCVQIAFMLQELHVFIDDLACVASLVAALPTLRQHFLKLGTCYLFLEFRCSPAAAPIEFEPLFHIPAQRLLRVRENSRMGNRITWPIKRMIGVLAIWIHPLATHLSTRSCCITRSFTGDITHVTVLAGHALLERRGRTVLCIHNFQCDAGMNHNLMTWCTELAPRNLLELNCLIVQLLTRQFVVSVQLYFKMIGSCFDLFDTFPSTCSVYRIENIARFNASFTVDAVVRIFNAMTSDAGDPFAEDSRAINN